MAGALRRGWKLLVVSLVAACLIVLVQGADRRAARFSEPVAASENPALAEPRLVLRSSIEALSPREALPAASLEAREASRFLVPTFASLAGSVEKTIQALRVASTRSPENAAILNDLAAAYFVQSRRGKTDSLLQALSTVEKALEQDPDLDEALFNRALFLEDLSLQMAAEAAWERYLEAANESEWSAQAKWHLEKLRQPSRADQWNRNWRSLKPLREDIAEVRRIVEISPEAAREYAMIELLGQWGELHLEGRHESAAVSLQAARAIGQALDQGRGDRTVSEAVRLIETSGPSLLARLARGHRAYREGHALLDRTEVQRAVAHFEQSIDFFAQTNRPLEFWARATLAQIKASEARYEEAGDSLWPVREEVLADRYPSLAAQVDLCLGAVQFRQGLLDDSWNIYKEASVSLGRAREYESLGTLYDLMVEVSEALGQEEQALQYRLLALQQLREALGPTASLGQLLRETGEKLMAREGGQGGRLGLLFQEEAIRVFERSGRSVGTPVPLLKRDASIVDLVQAHLTLARSQAAAGMDTAAEANLWQAIYLFEGRGDLLSHGLLKLSYAETAQELFDEMILFQVERRGDPRRALEVAERARTLWSPTLTVPAAGDSSSFRSIPAGVMLVEFALVKDRLLIWLIDSDRVRLVRQAVDVQEIQELVRAFVGALQRGRSSPESETASSKLYQLLIPEEVESHGARELYLVPDKFLNGLPFAALRNPEDGRFLIEARSLGVCPSVAQCLRSLTESSRWKVPARTALLIGNPDFDQERFPTVPSLGGPLREVSHLIPLYDRAQVFSGKEATRGSVLANLDRHDVLHYAGHAIGSSRNPEYSFLILAPGLDDSGMLHARDLSGRKFVKLRLVVLSACDTITALDSRLAGVSGLARPFLDGGVEAVVGGLWKVDDRGAETLLPLFHQRFTQTGNAAVALRDAQRALLQGSEPALRQPGIWGSFQLIGASTSYSPRQIRSR